jgi:phage-related protein (TIGR01555 family)
MKNRKLHTVPRSYQGAPLEDAQVTREDGWFNYASGIGTADDRNEYTQFSLTGRDVKLMTAQLEAMYYSDDLIARMCDLVPEEELRRGFTVELDEDLESAGKINAYHEKLTTAQIIMRARKWANVFGSSLVIIGANDGASIDQLKEPLNEGKIRSVDYLSVLYGNYIRPAYLATPGLRTQIAGYYSDPTQPNYGQVQLWSVSSPFGGQVFEIHESRCILFNATDVTPIRTMANAGIADSLIQRAYPVLQQINIAFKALATVVSENGQGVWKIQDLAAMLARDPTEFMRRMKISDMAKSVTRSIVVDTAEDFQRQYGSLTGYKDIFEILMARLSACVRIPQTILFGRSPAGMSATGDSDFRQLYDRVRNKQETELRPALIKISRMIAQAKDAQVTREVDLDSINVCFPELHQATEAEVAAIELQKAQAVNVYLAAGVVTPEEVAQAAFGDEGYSTLLHIDMDEHEQLVEEQAAQEQAEAQKQLEIQQAKVGLLGGAKSTNPKVKVDYNENHDPSNGQFTSGDDEAISAARAAEEKEQSEYYSANVATWAAAEGLTVAQYESRAAASKAIVEQETRHVEEIAKVEREERQARLGDKVKITASTKDEKKTDWLRAQKRLRARSDGSQARSIESAGHYARQQEKDMYVYPVTIGTMSTIQGSWAVSPKSSDYLNPISNSGSSLHMWSVSPSLEVTRHEITHPYTSK